MKEKKLNSKKKIIFFIVFILLIQMIQNFVPMNIVFAEDAAVNDFAFITKISLADKNGEAYDLESKKFEKNSNLRIYYNFEIPSGQSIESGKELKIAIPKEFNVNEVKVVSINATQASNTEVTTGAGAVVEPAIIGIENGGNNNLIVKFNGQKTESSKISGEFYVEVCFNSQEIGAVTTKSISFTANGQTMQEFTIKFDNQIKFPFITGVYLSDQKFEGDLDFENESFEDNYKKYLDEHLNKTTLEKNSQMYIGYKFTIPEDTVINEGQTFSVSIPNEFAKILKNTDGISLVTKDGTAVGTVVYSTDNQVKITFKAFSNDHSEITGYFWLGRKFNENEIGDTNPVGITFEVPYFASKTFSINFKQTPFTEIEPTITKTGEYSVQDQLINWKIEVDPGNLDRSEVSVQDKLDALKNTFKSDSLRIDGKEADNSYFSDNKLIYSFGEIKSGEKRVIEFQTEPSLEIINKQGEEIPIQNTATLKMRDKEDKNSTVTVKVKNDFIYKEGKYNSITKSIDWTIRVNTSKISFQKPFIIDKLPANLSLNKSTVTFDGTSVDDSKYTYNESDRIFIYGLPSDSNEHIIKFSTIISSKVIQDTFFTVVGFDNDVQLDVNNKSYLYKAPTVNVGVSNDMLTKVAAGYDKDTKEITWKIYVNNIGITINNAKITELLNINQEYVEGSISCDKLPEIQIQKVPATIKPISYPNQYEIGLGTIKEPCVITLKTKVKSDSIIYANKKSYCENVCQLNGDNIRMYEAKSSQEVDSTLIQKDGKYDYTNREITWTVTVNGSKTPIKDVNIIDKIEDGQEYVDNSFSVTRISGTKDGVLPSDGFSYTPNSTSDLGKGGILRYHFGTINDNYKITFKTKVAYDSKFNQNSDVTVQNNAEFTTSETTWKINCSKTVKIDNYLIEKDYAYTIGNDFVTWKVNLNKNNVPLDSMKITDTIPIGLQTDMDSIKLYEVKFDVNGNLISANNKEVSSSEYTTSYNFATRNFVLEYPKETNKAYLLIFDTVISKSGGSFTNSISLDTKGTGYTSSKESSKVQFSEDLYGGGASETFGTLVIKKVNKENGSQTLNGAEFALIKDGKIIQVSEPTGADGKAVFKRLKFNTVYSVQEIKAPYGYILNDNKYDFTITKGEFYKNVKECQIENQPIKKNIEFYKKSPNGNFLKDVEFKLYLASDEKYKNPIKTSISDENGKVVFENIGLGEYRIKESAAPKEYALSSDIIKATVNGSGNNGDIVKADPDTVINKYITKSLQLFKKSEENLPLEGATFALYKAEDTKFENIIKAAKSNADGVIVFDNVEYGNYVIKEENAPQGYDISKELTKVAKEDFIKDQGSSTIALGTVTDMKTKPKVITTIEFYKKSPSDTPVNGAIFGLYSEADVNFENPLGTTVSDINGLVKFNNIVQGNYKIKEIKAPEGYNLSDTVIHVTEGEFKENEPIKTNPYTVIDEIKVVISTGKIIDYKGTGAKPIETKASIQPDGKTMVSVNAKDAVAFKKPDGTNSPLNDLSKLTFSSENVIISADGNIQIKNLDNKADKKIDVTFELNGQKIRIGTIEVKVNSDGSVDLISQLIDPYGIITDKATGNPIVGVDVIVYYADTARNKLAGKTPGDRVPLPELDWFMPNKNKNPQVSDVNGAYGFMVFPSTDYYIVATKSGYNKYISGVIPVEFDIVRHDIQMTKSTGGSGSSKSSGDSSSKNNNEEIINGINTQDNNDNSNINRNSNEDIVKNDNSTNLQDYSSNNNETLKTNVSYGNNLNKLLPQAGRFIDFTVLMSCGIILILLGIWCRFRKKFLVK